MRWLKLQKWIVKNPPFEITNAIIDLAVENAELVAGGKLIKCRKSGCWVYKC